VRSSLLVAPRAASAWVCNPPFEHDVSVIDLVTDASRAIGRLLQSADFVRVLKTPIRAKSPHFAIHHLADRPSVSKPTRPSDSELSTGDALQSSLPVDDFALQGLWLGAVVPKRHAKRAVTRTMLKRQIRSAMAATPASITQGIWVVRLRAPFDRTAFPSATSGALVKVVRDELQAAFSSAVTNAAASSARRAAATRVTTDTDRSRSLR
jgi:ribonuclease P protein component